MTNRVVGQATVELKMDYKANLKKAVKEIQDVVGKVSLEEVNKKNAKAVGELEEKIKSLEEALKKVNNTASGGGGAKGGISSLTKQLTALSVRVVSVTTAITVMRKAVREFVSSVKEFAKFDAQLRTTSIIADSTGQSFGKLRDAIYDLGKSPLTTEIGKINQSMYKLASAGLDATEIMQVLPDAIQTSVGVSEDLDKTIQLLVSTINGFNKDFSEAPEVMDLFARAVANSQATIEKLGVGLARVSPIAEQLNIDLETTVGVFGKLVDTGLSASRSGTVLVNTFKGLSTFTPKSQSAIEGLGLALQDVDLQFNTLDQALERLANTNYTDSDLQAIFGTRGKLISGILRNLKEGQKLQDLVNDITGSGGKDVFSEAQLNTLNQSITRLNNSVTELRYSAVELTSGTMISTLDSMAKYVEGITNMIKEAKELQKEGRGAEGISKLVGSSLESSFKLATGGNSKGIGIIFDAIGKVMGDVQQQIGVRGKNKEGLVPTSEQDELDAQISSINEANRRYSKNMKAIGSKLTEIEQESLATLEAQNIISKEEKRVNAIYDKRAQALAREVQEGGDIDDYAVKVTRLQEERKKSLAEAIIKIGDVGLDSDSLSASAKEKVENLRVNVDTFLEQINNKLTGEKSDRASAVVPSDRGENLDVYYRSVLANITDAQKELKGQLNSIDDFYNGLADLTQINPQLFDLDFDQFIDQIPEMYKNLFGLNSDLTRDAGMQFLGEAYDVSKDPEIKSLIENRQREATTLMFESILGDDGLSEIYGLFETFKAKAQSEATGVSEEYANRIYQQINQVETFIIQKLTGYEKSIAEANLLNDSDITKAFDDISREMDRLPSTLEKLSLIFSNLANTGEIFSEADVLSQLSASERSSLGDVDVQRLMEDVFSDAKNPKSATEIAKYIFGNQTVVSAQSKAIEEQAEANAKAFDEFISRSDITPEQRKYAQSLKELNDSGAIELMNENFNNLNEVLDDIPSNLENIAGFSKSLGGLLGQIGKSSGNDFLSNIGGAIGGFGSAFDDLSKMDFSANGLGSIEGLQGLMGTASSGIQIGGSVNSLLGQESNMASTLLSGLGSVAGSFAADPAIGSAIGGALGGALGGLFGGGSDKNKQMARERKRQEDQDQAIKDFQRAVDDFVNAVTDSGIEQAFDNLASLVNAPTDSGDIKKILDSGRYGSDNITGDVLREVLPQFDDEEILNLIRSTLGAGNFQAGGNFDTGYGSRGGFNTGALAKEIARLNEEMADGLTDNLISALDIATSKFKDAFSDTLLTGESIKGQFESIISGAYQNALSNTSTVVSFSNKLQDLLIRDIEEVIRDSDLGLTQDVDDFETIEEALDFMDKYSDASSEALDKIIEKYGLIGLQIDKINAEMEYGLIKLRGEGASELEQQRYELQKTQEQFDLLEEGTKEWYEAMAKIRDLEENIFEIGQRISRNQQDTADIRNLISAYESEAKALDRLYEDVARAREQNDLEAITNLEKQIAELEERKAMSIKNSLSSAVVSGLSEGITSSGAIDFESIGDKLRQQVYQAQLDNIIETILGSSEINDAINQLTRSVEDGAIDEAESILDGLLGLIDGSLDGFEEQIAKIEEILGSGNNTDPIVFFDEQNLDDVLKAVDTVGERELEQQKEDEKVVRILLTKDGGDLTDAEISKLAEVITKYGLQVDTSNIT